MRNRDGSPSELTLRRWENFGRSGAQVDLGRRGGGGATGRPANPHQTLATPENRAGLAQLLDRLLERASRPLRHDGRSAGRPATDAFGSFQPAELANNWNRASPTTIRCWTPKFGIAPTTTSVVWTDSDLERLIDNYVDRRRRRA